MDDYRRDILWSKEHFRTISHSFRMEEGLLNWGCSASRIHRSYSHAVRIHLFTQTVS